MGLSGNDPIDENMNFGSQGETDIVRVGLVAICITVVMWKLVQAVRNSNWLYIRRMLKNQRLTVVQGVPVFLKLRKVIKLINRPSIPKCAHHFQLLSGLGKIFEDKELFLFLDFRSKYFVFLRKPAAIEVLLASKSEVNKSEEYTSFRALTGDGLVTNQYPKWKKHRRMVSPAFHVHILDTFQENMQVLSEKLADKLQAEVGKPFTNLENYLQECALEIAAASSFGMNATNLPDRLKWFMQMVIRSNHTIWKRGIMPWLRSDLIFNLLPEGRQFKKDKNILRSIISKAIEKRRKEILEAGDDECDVTGKEPKLTNHTLIDVLLAQNAKRKEDKMTEDEIIDEAITFILAAFDTSYMSTMFTMYLIGLYPEVQAKVHRELDEIFGEDLQRRITPGDLREMCYLTNVIKESLRLYSPITMMARQLREDLKINEVTLPKGVTCLVVPAHLHMDPELFPEPETFNPDRFLTDDRRTYSFLPFSTGPRNCIGHPYAMLELKTVLANVLRRYALTSLDPRDKVVLCSEVVIHPLKPLRIKLENRK